jgi:uncharacterized protein (DUF1499 family)
MSEAPPTTPSGSPAVSVAPRRRPISRIALVAAGLAVAGAILAMLAGLGSRWGLWHFRTGFDLLRWAVYGELATLLIALVAVVRTRPGTPHRGFPLAMFALVVALAFVAVPWSWQRQARSVPPIHDITTDTENPPRFVDVLPLRADAPNSAEYEGAEIAAQQREAYPDIRPVVLTLPPERAFQRALDAARGMGWDIVAADPAAGRIEATDETFWFGFKDDVVIRLTPTGGRTVLDVRSVSRVGRSDVGTNAERIREYIEAVQG